MRKVIHLLPYDGIGGAEAAARSMADLRHETLDFQLRYLFPQVRIRADRRGTNNPLAFASAVRSLIRDKPDLLILSLWRSCAAGILVKLFRPGTRLVVLIHNSVDAHFLDFLLTRWAMRLSHAIWADSAASMRMRFSRKPRQEATVIPFLTQHLEPVRDIEECIQPQPHFVFWGRLAAQKNLTEAIDIFHRLWKIRSDARFMVIGPDAGELDALSAECATRGMEAAVSFSGALPFEAITEHARQHDFYLQTSSYEGMAMSVVESMQLGLVPVVTPVGEAGHYCRDRFNSVIVKDVDQTIADILHLLADPAAFRILRRNAILTWQGKPLYRDAVITESLRLTRTDAGDVNGDVSR